MKIISFAPTLSEGIPLVKGCKLFFFTSANGRQGAIEENQIHYRQADSHFFKI